MRQTLTLAHKNAFSDLLDPLGSNFYDIFAVDVMHEIEIGVWKMTYGHLLEILILEDPTLRIRLNQR